MLARIAFSSIMLVGCGSTYQAAEVVPACFVARGCAATSVVADSSLATGSLGGIVVGRPDLCPLRFAEVWSRKGNVATVARNDGTFRIEAFPPGPDTLVVRSIGYHRTSVPIEMPPSGGLRILVAMEPAAISSERDTLCPAA